MEPLVYLVVFMDGNWDGYHPFAPPYEESSLTLPDVEEIQANAYEAMELMRDVVDGKFVFGVHTGVYCRELFYRAPLIECWKTLVNQGGELSLHPHEEIVGVGSLFKYETHMRTILTRKYEQLAASEVAAGSFRGGYFGLSAEIMSILEELDIKIDLSCAPNIDVEEWCAHWQQAPASAYYLCPRDPSHVDCEHMPSQVLEIPLGWDGKGHDFRENYLFNEASTLERLKLVWEALINRAKAEQKPQFVQFLCHLHAMGYGDLKHRCSRFLDYVQDHGAHILTPTEAHETYKQINMGP